MKKYKLECWYRYAGANEKEFLTFNCEAKDLESAENMAREENSALNFFKIEIKSVTPISVIEKIDFLIELATSVDNNFLKNKLTQIKAELC